jgi:hypothetical protein
MSSYDEATRKLHKETTDYVQDFLNNVTKYAEESIYNSKLRQEYITLAQKSATDFLKLCEARVDEKFAKAFEIWDRAAKDACKQRNLYLQLTRKNMSAASLAFSKMVKDEGLTFPKLISKYTKKFFEMKPYESLTEHDQKKVLMAIIEASGRTNPNVDAFSLWTGRASVFFIVITVSLTIYFICESANPKLKAVKTAVSLGVGLVAAKYGGELGSIVGSCGGPIGVFIGAIVGGFLFGCFASLAGETLVDHLYNAFVPAASAGPGPPPLGVRLIENGPPPLDVSGVVRPQISPINDMQMTTGPPSLGVKATIDFPALWK